MSLERIGRKTRQTVLRELVTVITSDAAVNRAWASLRAGDRETAVMQALARTYGGEIVRLYVPQKHAFDRDERDRRVRAMASAPACLPLAQIAKVERLSVRQVRRILGRE